MLVMDLAGDRVNLVIDVHLMSDRLRQEARMPLHFVECPGGHGEQHQPKSPQKFVLHGPTHDLPKGFSDFPCVHADYPFVTAGSRANMGRNGWGVNLWLSPHWGSGNTPAGLDTRSCLRRIICRT